MPEIKEFEASPFIWTPILDKIEWNETEEASQLWASAKTLREKSDMIFSMFYSFYVETENNSKHYYLYDQIYYSISVALAKAYFDCSWKQIMNESQTVVLCALLNLVPYTLRKLAEAAKLDFEERANMPCLLHLKMGDVIKELHKIHGGIAPETVSYVQNDFSENTFDNDKDNRIYKLQATLIGIVQRQIVLTRNT